MNQNLLDNRYMEFRMGDQLFALPLLIVKEVIQKPDVTSVPNMPSHFEGMINLRGQILGVFSIRKKLGAKAKTADEVKNEVVVVIEDAGVNVGMIVDEVTRVLHATPDSLKPAPLKEGDPAKPYIVSVIQTEQDLVLTIDVNKLLDLEKTTSLNKGA